jgi:hypothetical protein
MKKIKKQKLSMSAIYAFNGKVLGYKTRQNKSIYLIAGSALRLIGMHQPPGVLKISPQQPALLPAVVESPEVAAARARCARPAD